MVLQNLLQRRLLHGTASVGTHSPWPGRSRIGRSGQGRRCLNRRRRNKRGLLPFETTTSQTPSSLRPGSCALERPIEPTREDDDSAHGRRSSRQILRPQRPQSPHLLLAHGRGEEAAKAHSKRPCQNRGRGLLLPPNRALANTSLIIVSFLSRA